MCTKTGSKNNLFLNCRRKRKELSKKELSKKELSNVAPASDYFTWSNFLINWKASKILVNWLWNFWSTEKWQFRSTDFWSNDLLSFLCSSLFCWKTFQSNFYIQCFFWNETTSTWMKMLDVRYEWGSILSEKKLLD
jgi:hypothetical protein